MDSGKTLLGAQRVFRGALCTGIAPRFYWDSQNALQDLGRPVTSAGDNFTGKVCPEVFQGGKFTPTCGKSPKMQDLAKRQFSAEVKATCYQLESPRSRLNKIIFLDVSGDFAVLMSPVCTKAGH